MEKPEEIDPAIVEEEKEKETEEETEEEYYITPEENYELPVSYARQIGALLREHGYSDVAFQFLSCEPGYDIVIGLTEG